MEASFGEIEEEEMKTLRIGKKEDDIEKKNIERDLK
jgi:hypothetical protein